MGNCLTQIAAKSHPNTVYTVYYEPSMDFQRVGTVSPLGQLSGLQCRNAIQCKWSQSTYTVFVGQGSRFYRQYAVPTFQGHVVPSMCY